MNIIPNLNTATYCHCFSTSIALAQTWLTHSMGSPMVRHHFLSPIGPWDFCCPSGRWSLNWTPSPPPPAAVACVLARRKCWWPWNVTSSGLDGISIWVPVSQRQEINQRYPMAFLQSFASWELMTMPTITARLLRWLLRWLVAFARGDLVKPRWTQSDAGQVQAAAAAWFKVKSRDFDSKQLAVGGRCCQEKWYPLVI